MKKIHQETQKTFDDDFWLWIIGAEDNNQGEIYGRRQNDNLEILRHSA